MGAAKTGRANIVAAAWRLGLYGILALSPFIVEGFSEEQEFPEPIMYSLGKAAALLGFSMLALQFGLSARIKWFERPFGLDRVMRFHKWAGITAGVLVVSHPVNLAIGGAGWEMILSVRSPWQIAIAKVAMAVLIVSGVMSLYRLALRLEFQKWRLIHDASAPVILGLGLVHAWTLGSDLRGMPAEKALFALLAAAAAAGLVYVRIVGPLWRRMRSYEVRSVKQETRNVWTVELAPPTGRKRFDFLPGQFQFLTLYRKGLPVEEHPFTISSSPTLEGAHTSTIKESGDFTVTIGKTKAGDRAAVEGPFGRFSYVLHPEEKDIVFIAGGIGITPLMSMLRHMRDTAWDGDVLLLYANRTEADIAFREELAAMERGGTPRLKVAHVLGDAKEGWQGEKGYIDAEKIKRLCVDACGKAFYLCGPPPMMMKIRGTLRGLGVARRRIHYEFFSL